MTSHVKWLLLGTTAALFLNAATVQAGTLNSLPTQQQNSQAALVQIADDQSQAALAFVKGATGEGLAFLSDTSLSLDQKRAKFRTLLTRNFDLNTIGRFALGPYWREATPAEQSSYLKLFNDMVVEVYTNRFQEYNGEKLTVESAKPAVSGKDMIVTSYINPTTAGGEKVRVDWRVRANGNNFRVVDVIVEGVSMSQTQRSEFASVIQRGGGKVSALITHLQNQIKVAKAP